MLYNMFGGGGGSKSSISATVITLDANEWEGNSQIISVEGVTEDNIIVVSYTVEDMVAYMQYGIYCSEQDLGELTFACMSTPSEDITVNVLIIDTENK